MTYKFYITCLSADLFRPFLRSERRSKKIFRLDSGTITSEHSWPITKTWIFLYIIFPKGKLTYALFDGSPSTKKNYLSREMFLSIPLTCKPMALSLLLPQPKFHLIDFSMLQGYALGCEIMITTVLISLEAVSPEKCNVKIMRLLMCN